MVERTPKGARRLRRGSLPNFYGARAIEFLFAGPGTNKQIFPIYNSAEVNKLKSNHFILLKHRQSLIINKKWRPLRRPPKLYILITKNFPSCAKRPKSVFSPVEAPQLHIFMTRKLWSRLLSPFCLYIAAKKKWWGWSFFTDNSRAEHKNYPFRSTIKTFMNFGKWYFIHKLPRGIFYNCLLNVFLSLDFHFAPWWQFYANLIRNS